MAHILKYINKNKWTIAFNKLTDKYAVIDNINSLFHLACIRGNKNIINKYLKLNSDNINIANNEGNTCCHLLGLNKHFKLLLKLVEKYPNCLTLINNNNKTIISCISNYDTIISVIQIIKNNNLFNKINFESFIIKILLNTNSSKDKYFNIIKILYENNVNLNYTLFNLFKNNKYNIIKYYLKHFKKIDINTNIYNFITPLIIAVSNNKYSIVKLLLTFHNTDNIVDVNFGGNEKKYIPVFIAINKKYWKIVKILLNHNVNYNNKDNNLNTALHHLINTIRNTKISKKIMKLIFDNSDLMAENINGETPLLLIMKYKLLNRCKKYLNKMQINKLEEYYKLPQKKINYPNIIKTNYGLFNADIIHSILYFIYMMSKYDLIVPIRTYNKEQYKWDKNNFQNQSLIDNSLLNNIVDEALTTSYTFFPYLLYWNNKNLYFYSNDTELCLQRVLKFKQRFVALKLSILSQENLHANIVLYDKKTNVLIRFEPYGDFNYMNNDLDKKIYKLFKKCLHKNCTYLTPSDYLGDANYQLSSNENDMASTKLGDPEGYCLAWCLWYLELKMRNPDIDDIYLIKRTIQNITNTYKNTKYPLLTHIRNYAMFLDNEKNKILKSYGILEDEIYQLHYSDNLLKLIQKNINKYCLGLLM